MDRIIAQMLAADNGSAIAGFGTVIGYEQATTLRRVAAALGAARAEAPPMTYNVVCYYRNGARLAKPGTMGGVRVVHDDNGLACFYHHDVLLRLDKIISMNVFDCGIWVEGLEHRMAAPSAAGGHNLIMVRTIHEARTEASLATALANEVEWELTYVYQRLLLTNLTFEELEQRNYLLP